MQALDRKFTKTYKLPASQASSFKYTTIVRHKGTVIAFAMDSKQRIYYSVLDFEREGVKGTLDSQYWDEKPKELIFPAELAQVGFSAVGVRTMPIFRKNGASGPVNLSDKEKDLFLSTTARFTADAPFQVLSDEKHVYVFRQAVDRKNDRSKIKPTDTVSLVDCTLLCDRFVFVGGELKPKLETRYQRSRNKDLPADRKDGLGYEDLEKKPFYEPTQELAFIRNLIDGRFSLVLLPTSLPDVQRWQIFAFNSATQRMDSFNIARSADGLFNTRGTRYYTSPEEKYQNSVFERQPGKCPFTDDPLIEIVSESGFAESALALNGVDEFVKASLVKVPPSPRPDSESAADFSLEVWLKADVAKAGTAKEQSIVDRWENGRFPFAICYLADSGKVVALRPDDPTKLTITSNVSIKDGKFHHVAFVKRKTDLSLYIDGENVGIASDPLPLAVEEGLSLCFGCREGNRNFFKGQLDEIRLWQTARSQEDLKADLHHRLIGNEAALIGYWRFDEGAGTQVFDQTDQANHAQLYAGNASDGPNWVKSEAAVGEHPGVRRSSFAINGRQIASGCSALLYYQQEQAKTGYDPKDKPIKRNARVMLAVPTAPQKPNETSKNLIAVLDFAISRDGGLVQIPDQLPLTTLETEKVGDIDLNDILDSIRDLEQEEQKLTSSIKAKTIQLEAIEQRLDASIICDVRYLNDDGWHLFNGSKYQLNEGIQTIAESKWQGLPKEWQETGIDAIVNWNAIVNGNVSGSPKCFIFKGDQCLLYDPKNYRPLGDGQPRLIKKVFTLPSDDWHTGFDAAIRDEEKAYFFKNNQRLYFEGIAIAIDNPLEVELPRTPKYRPALIKDMYPGVPSDLDGVDNVIHNVESVYFFKGNRYVCWEKNPDRRRRNPPVWKPYHELTESSLVAFADAVRAPLRFDRDRLQGEISTYEYDRQETRKALVEQRKLLQTAVGEVRLDMPLLYTDPAGLTLSGAVLGFAWSDCPPLLFEGINGRVSLYFRGRNGQFFSTYYDVLAQRANYTLTAKTETGSGGLIWLIARSTTLQKSAIEVSDAETPNTCTVQIANPGMGITETWSQVPRQVQDFADVLNGAAQPVYLGRLLKPLSGTIESIDLDGQAGPKLVARATLSIGQTSVGQTKVSVQSISPILTSSAAVLRGTVLEFDGQNDYVQLTDAATLGLIDQDFTVEAWIRVGNLANPQGNGDRPVLGTDSPRESNKGLHLIIRDGKPHFGFFDTDLTGKRSLNPDIWYHIAWRYTKATQEQAIFVNGELDDSKTGQSAFLGRGMVNIGRWNGDRYFKGLISEVRIWNEARSLDQLRDNMNRRLTDQPAPANLAGYWRFETQNNQVIAKDDSQHQRNGMMQGNPQLLTIDAEATRVQIAPIALDQPIEAGTSVYRVFYDYATNAQTNKATHSLEAGSLSFRVNSTGASGEVETNGGKQIAKEDASAATNCWFTDSQNSALIFKEKAAALILRENAAPPTTEERLRRFAFSDDITLEAWVNHGTLPKSASILQYNSGSSQSSYALGLFRDTAANQTAEGRYGVVARVGDRWVKTAPVKSAQEWRQIAAVFQQSYALKFGGPDDVVNCGNDITLDFPEGLTIEASIRLNHLKTPQAILTKGRIDDGTEQDCAYSLYVDLQGKLVFAFEDKDRKNQFLYSEIAIAPQHDYRVAVTRAYRTEVKTEDGETEAKAESWYDINLFIYRVGTDLQRDLKQTQCDRYEGGIGSNKQPLEIGQAVAQVDDLDDSVEPCHLNGEISEVRIWNRALSKAEVCRSINGDEKGLVSWWRFEENQGTRAADSKSSNHGTIANATWTKSQDAESSRLTVYINGESVQTQPWTKNQPSGDAPLSADALPIDAVPFSIGKEYQGQLDEIRIWNVARTEEQIQDNLFRRISGDLEHLLAYYNCDTNSEKVLEDQSGRGLELAIPNVNDYLVLSTAPISSETAQVRNALAQVKTPFHTTIDTAPAVHEYGDMQTDSDGSAIGIMKRCYAYIKDGSWHLITGYKVGDLELEWIGQAQYEPQLIGFIEGAPPVPSENLTVRNVNQGEIYDEVSSVELIEADQVMYTYAASKETAFDFALSVKGGLGFKSETLAGIGVASSVEETDSSIGVKSNLEISKGMLQEKQFSFGKGRTQISRLKVQGAWENPNDVRYPDMGRRYVPQNIGYALVKSKTADIFALRVKHPDPKKRTTIALSVRPNPDIPEDWNIITFPINPLYTKQGSLDGKIGLGYDEHYPNVKDGGSDRSYFKPIEAYALKNRIEKEQQQLTADYQNYTASYAQANNFDKVGPESEATRRRMDPTRANLFNTYVWTADGGFFAETQNAMSLKQETTASQFSVSGMSGLYLDLNTMIAKASVKLELEALFGGHMNLVSQKSSTSESGFGVNVELSVERDISIKSEAQAKLVGKAAGGLYDEKNNPVKCPGKVDGYRFMTFYLQPDIEHFNDFRSKVIDRTWLQSSDPNAKAISQATASTNGVWRVLHRVTFVSRVISDPGTAPITRTEEKLRAANIESNWELVKTLDPFVKTKSGNAAELRRAVEQAIKDYLPELIDVQDEIVKYMTLYYQTDL